MSASPLALLGRGLVLPAAARPAHDDPELAMPEVALPVRTAGRELAAAPAGMTRWPRLDRYGRVLAVAVARALADPAAREAQTTRPESGVRSDTEGATASSTGLYICSQYSCFDTNAAFHRGLVDKGPRLASPLVFPYTLPGAAAAEVAMHFRLGGEHVVFAGGAAAALACTLAAADAVSAGDHSLVLAAADVLGSELLRARASAEPLVPGVPPAEAASALWLARATSHRPGLRFAIEGALGPSGADPEAWAVTIRGALERAEVAPGEVARVLSASTAEPARRAEIEGVSMVRRDLAVVQLCFTLGDPGAALGLLALLSALEEPGPSLVVASDRGGTAALVVVPELV